MLGCNQIPVVIYGLPLITTAVFSSLEENIWEFKITNKIFPLPVPLFQSINLVIFVQSFHAYFKFYQLFKTTQFFAECKVLALARLDLFIT